MDRLMKGLMLSWMDGKLKAICPINFFTVESIINYGPRINCYSVYELELLNWQSVLNTQIYYAMEMKTLFNRFNLQDYMHTSHGSKKSDVNDKRLILFFLIKLGQISIELELQSNLVNSEFFLQIKGILVIK